MLHDGLDSLAKGTDVPRMQDRRAAVDEAFAKGAARPAWLAPG
jgi:hypothetical protein